MRLLVFSPYFQPHIGGLEGYVRDLDEELIRLELVDAITVLTPRIPPDGAPFERLAPNYRVVRHPAFEAIPNFPCPAPWRRGFASAVRAALDPKEYDVVVSHTRFFLSSLAALAFSRSTGLPLLHVEHGSDYVHLASRAHSAAARTYDVTLGRLVLRHAQAVVAVSNAAARFVEELAGREAHVIYRGVERLRYDAVEPSAQLTDWAGERPVVTFVGRLIDGKGVADLIESFARLESTQAVLCVVGEGPRRSELGRLCAERGITSRVMFTGYQPEERALELIRASDVVVNPSYTEGLPTSVLEAALLGRAVLASDVGGTPEVVTNKRSALLVPAGDLPALQDGLTALLAEPALRMRLGAAAHEDAVTRFDRETSARHFSDVASELVDSSSGSFPAQRIDTSHSRTATSAADRSSPQP
jgi:glycosyltransferase involved in cell wall biosynthesis